VPSRARLPAYRFPPSTHHPLSTKLAIVTTAGHWEQCCISKPRLNHLSTTNSPLSAMHLNVQTPSSMPAKISLDPFVKSTTPDLLRPLSTLVPGFSTHFPPDPDGDSRVLHAALLPTAVVLRLDVSAVDWTTHGIWAGATTVHTR